MIRRFVRYLDEGQQSKLDWATYLGACGLGLLLGLGMLYSVPV